jgi:GH24 family phage-related lysozyme (muramidase)
MKRAADNAHELLGLTNYERARKQAEQELRGFREQYVPEKSDPKPYAAPMAAGFDKAGAAALKLAFALESAAERMGGKSPSLPIFASGAAPADAAAMIRQFESFSPRAYWDVNAWRAGYGSDTVTRADGSVERVTADTAVSLEDAGRDLTRRLREFDMILKKQIGAGAFEGLSPSKRAALEDIAYNYGSLPPRILPAIRSGDESKIAAAIRALASDNNGVNRARRQAEANLFVPQLPSTADRVATQASATKLKDIDYQFADQKLKDVNAELENQNRLLDAQKSALGQDNTVMQGAIEAQKLLNYFLSEHIPVTGRLKDKIIEAEQAEAERVKHEEDFAKAQRRIIGELDLARDSVSGVFESIALAGAHGESITKALSQSLRQIGDNLINSSISTFTEDLLGAKGTMGTGLFGSILGTLGLGGKQQVTQANITAGVVNVNGGLTSGLGGGLGTTGGLFSGVSGFFSGAGGMFSTFTGWPGSLFSFETGGIMTPRGPLPLHRYAMGGIASSPQLALFGEGRTPEAYVPLPDGRSIPVSIKAPASIPEIVKIVAAGNRQAAAGFSPTVPAQRPAGHPQPIVNLHIATPDRRSFEASEAQLTSMLTRMLARGARYA